MLVQRRGKEWWRKEDWSVKGYCVIGFAYYRWGVQLLKRWALKKKKKDVKDLSVAAL